MVFYPVGCLQGHVYFVCVVEDMSFSIQLDAYRGTFFCVCRCGHVVFYPVGCLQGTFCVCRCGHVVFYPVGCLQGHVFLCVSLRTCRFLSSWMPTGHFFVCVVADMSFSIQLDAYRGTFFCVCRCGHVVFYPVGCLQGTFLCVSLRTCRFLSSWMPTGARFFVCVVADMSFSIQLDAYRALFCVCRCGHVVLYPVGCLQGHVFCVCRCGHVVFYPVGCLQGTFCVCRCGHVVFYPVGCLQWHVFLYLSLRIRRFLSA